MGHQTREYNFSWFESPSHAFWKFYHISLIGGVLQGWLFIWEDGGGHPGQGLIVLIVSFHWTFGLVCRGALPEGVSPLLAIPVY